MRIWRVSHFNPLAGPRGLSGSSALSKQASAASPRASVTAVPLQISDHRPSSPLVVPRYPNMPRAYFDDLYARGEEPRCFPKMPQVYFDAMNAHYEAHPPSGTSGSSMETLSYESDNITNKFHTDGRIIDFSDVLDFPSHSDSFWLPKQDGDILPPEAVPDVPLQISVRGQSSMSVEPCNHEMMADHFLNATVDSPNECVANVPTEKVSAATAKLATDKISVFNENRSMPRKPRKTGRAGKPLEGLVQLDKPRGTFKEPTQHHCHNPSKPACKQSNTESISLPTGGEKPVTESINLPTGSEKPGREKSVETITGVRFASVKGDRFTLDWWKVYLDSCATYHQ